MQAEQALEEARQNILKPSAKLEKEAEIHQAASRLQKILPIASEFVSQSRFLESLYFESLDARHANITVAHERTFAWILEQEQGKASNFVDWMTSQQGVYWISGKPGSGKSTLIKYLSDHPTTAKILRSWAGEAKLYIASFYFWNAGSNLQKSQEGLLRGLLYEVFSK